MDNDNRKFMDELSNDCNDPSSSTNIMGPPKFPSSTVPSNFNAEESATKSQTLGGEIKHIGAQTPKIDIPYAVPAWSHPPGQPYFLEVLKDGSIIEQLDVSKKGAYMFGRIDLCDFVLEHPTISRFHAVLQFKEDGETTIYDLGSTHGTSINKKEVRKKEYTKVNVGDVIRFGQSSRLYIFQGPSDLMPPEGDLEKIRSYKALREEMVDREASLTRAKIESSLADGISWGMAEDAIEESIDNDAEEITWQTYKGQLTERQEKTRGKIIKRMEKIANLKKEIDAIRVKDISQGGLTQGQQTQIARNEQRMSQLMEELESLEETLNDSIQESLGARNGKVVRNKKTGLFDEEDEILSDDDDFYDRTKKKSSSKKSNEKSVETADSLLNQKDTIVSEIEAKKELLQKEKDKLVITSVSTSTTGDDLDAYMNGLSSQLVINQTTKIEKEISDLQSELDRILYLLNIADPLGDAARKRDAKAKSPKPAQAVIDTRKPPQLKQRNLKDEKPKTASQVQNLSAPDKVSEDFEKEEKKTATPYIAPKPQWLGDVKGVKSEENHAKETVSEVPDPDNFIDYKDRKKVLASVNSKSELENAGPGLIVRKRKPVDKLDKNSDKTLKVEDLTSSEVESTVVDEVALLLKHKRGYSALDEETVSENKDDSLQQPKRVLGPSKPDFLEKSADYETWVPPKGQTGDGRTSLNDRLGY